MQVKSFLVDVGPKQFPMSSSKSPSTIRDIISFDKGDLPNVRIVFSRHVRRRNFDPVQFCDLLLEK